MYTQQQAYPQTGPAPYRPPALQQTPAAPARMPQPPQPLYGQSNLYPTNPSAPPYPGQPSGYGAPYPPK